MSKVAIVTDSNSGITQEEAKKRGVFVVPMPFFIDEHLYYEDVTLSQADFYKMITDNANVSTSQPTPADIMDLWKKVLSEYDELVYIPMSSGLSASCQTAAALAVGGTFAGRVFVVNNKRISVTQKRSVEDACALAGKGYGGEQIKEILEKNALNASIYLVVNDLNHLKKGGRITSAAALIGSVLNIKPVLSIQGDKLDAFAKARGLKIAKKTILDELKKELDTRFAEAHMEKRLVMHAVYSYGYEEEFEVFKEAVKEQFGNLLPIETDYLTLSVLCHTGPGVLAATLTEIPKEAVQG